MRQNLKSRLQSIRAAGKSFGIPKINPDGVSGAAEPTSSTRDASCLERSGYSNSSWSGWTEAGYKTLKREIMAGLSFSLPTVFPLTLAILIPDLLRMGRIPLPEELLFFDLETTGLSGGAGTIAFLAAFGRFVDSARIRITQYLLLDYPGESDFIEMTAKEFAASPPPLVVSYNGKCFDSQILKNRCLMNGIRIPEYYHADLLHPARRLWRRLLPDCSQATIEVSVLGLDRTGDVSGALAPDIWFSFLRTGENRELLSVCDHNMKDILGLASLFLGLGEIAAYPFESMMKLRFDEEALALCWREALKMNRLFFGGDESYGSCANTGEQLLKAAAGHGCPRASYILGLDLFKKGGASDDQVREGRALMLKIARDCSGDYVSDCRKAAALKSLAIDAEWRLGDPARALEYTVSALDIHEISASLRKELEKRRSRLEEKMRE